MPGHGPLDAIPVWALFVITQILILVFVEAGHRLGKYRRSRTELEKEGPVGSMVGATLGLLAFVLAFTFGLAAARFDARRQVLLDEANAIGTTYLRAEMLPDRRAEVRTMLRTYVDIRLQGVQSGNVTEGIRQSEELQNRLWAEAVAVAEGHPNSIIVGLYVQSLNEVIDLHAKRVTAGTRNRIPGAIWAALSAIALLSFAAMGYHAGLSRTTRSPAGLAVAVTFAVVIGLIADLDRPQEGALNVSQQALIDLQRSMQQPTP
jgi:hypothetical protein